MDYGKKAGRLSDEILLELKNKRGGKSEPADTGDDEGPADKGDPDEGDEGGDDETVIAGDLKTALDDGDPKEIAKALRDFIEACYPSLAK